MTSNRPDRWSPARARVHLAILAGGVLVVLMVAAYARFVDRPGAEAPVDTALPSIEEAVTSLVARSDSKLSILLPGGEPDLGLTLAAANMLAGSHQLNAELADFLRSQGDATWRAYFDAEHTNETDRYFALWQLSRLNATLAAAGQETVRLPTAAMRPLPDLLAMRHSDPSTALWAVRLAHLDPGVSYPPATTCQQAAAEVAAAAIESYHEGFGWLSGAGSADLCTGDSGPLVRALEGRLQVLIDTIHRRPVISDWDLAAAAQVYELAITAAPEWSPPPVLAELKAAVVRELGLQAATGEAVLGAPALAALSSLPGEATLPRALVNRLQMLVLTAGSLPDHQQLIALADVMAMHLLVILDLDTVTGPAAAPPAVAKQWESLFDLLAFRDRGSPIAGSVAADLTPDEAGDLARLSLLLLIHAQQDECAAVQGFNDAALAVVTAAADDGWPEVDYAGYLWAAYQLCGLTVAVPPALVEAAMGQLRGYSPEAIWRGAEALCAAGAWDAVDDDLRSDVRASQQRFVSALAGGTGWNDRGVVFDLYSALRVLEIVDAGCDGAWWQGIYRH